jgi:hypothetical protein
MYLETWMIVTIVLTFGICAWYNRKAGFTMGATKVLEVFLQQKLIEITDDGKIEIVKR